MEKNRVYVIIETERAEDGGYIPCIVTENEPGYHRTDWNWGDCRETAHAIAREKNALLGFTRKEAMLIELSAMR